MKTIPLIKPYLPPSEELMPVLQETLYSGYIAEGEAVWTFEKKMRDYLNNPFTLAMSSGTAALHVALILAGVKAGDEVISTAMTAEPTNVAIAMVGAKVVWADVDKDTGLLSPECVESCITQRTKAIMLVHYAGMVCNLEAFSAISKKHNIPIIEDAAHALGAEYKDTKIGSISQYTIFSLQAIKHMTTVDGGFLTVKNEADFERARRIRWFGLDKKKSRLENDITEVGYKYNMNNVTATIGNVQMKYIDYILQSYYENGKYFDTELSHIDGLKIVRYENYSKPAYWLYTILVENKDKFISELEKQNIIASPLHYRSDYHSLFSDSKKELPNLDDFYSKLVHIPCGWWVKNEERERIISAIKKGWQ